MHDCPRLSQLWHFKGPVCARVPKPVCAGGSCLSSPAGPVTISGEAESWSPTPTLLGTGCYHTAPRAPSPQRVGSSASLTLLGNRHTLRWSEEQTGLDHNRPQAALTWPRNPRPTCSRSTLEVFRQTAFAKHTCQPSSAGRGTTHAPHTCIQSPQKPPGQQWA